MHDSVQQAAYNTMTSRERTVLYSKIGGAFLEAIKPENLGDLLYEVLALLNKGIDLEDLNQRQKIAKLNLYLTFSNYFDC
jgi:predicted ATPase